MKNNNSALVSQAPRSLSSDNIGRSLAIQMKARPNLVVEMKGLKRRDRRFISKTNSGPVVWLRRKGPLRGVIHNRLRSRPLDIVILLEVQTFITKDTKDKRWRR